MLSVKFLFKNIKLFLKKMKFRVSNIDIQYLLNIYNDYKKVKFEIEYFQHIKKNWSKKIFLYKKKNINIVLLKYFVKLIKENIIFKKNKYKNLLLKLNNKLLYIPNIPHKDVPLGESDKDNKIVYYWGKKNKYKFKILDHVKFCKINGNIDFNDSVKLSGKSFVVLKNKIAILYRAISQFMIDFHVYNNNYKEVYVPYIVKSESLYGTGQLPKFDKDIFYVYKKGDFNDKFALIPTSEVSLVNLFKNKILDENDLPIKLVANTPCFRSESISYGKNNRGIIRLKQFDKIELIQIVHPIMSNKLLKDLTHDAEKILKLLKLSYRKVLLCSKCMGFSACKTYDIEAWSYIDNDYLEVSSCSNTSDFQSRRINARYYDINKKEKLFVHILNGSGLAVGRILVLIIENNQIETGIVKIPNVLRKYMNNIKYINYN